MSENIFAGRDRMTRASGVSPLGDKDSRNAASLPDPETMIHTFFAAEIIL